MKTIRTFAAAILASLLALTPATADIYNWSQTPATNTNSDLADDLNWVEGMAPSEVNDSARAMMSEIKKWVDDQGAVIPSATLMTTSGSANAQTLTTNGASASLKHGWRVCFIVGGGLTNTSSVTLNVDSTGATAVQGVDGTALAGGELAAGTFQCATFDDNDNVWLLDNFRPIDATSITYTSVGKIQRAALTGDVTASAGSNATTIAAGAVSASMLDTDVFTMPVGTVFDFAGTSCPSKSVAAYGQELDDTTYAGLLAVTGTTWGAGGAGTFNAPDLRGRVVSGEDDAGGVSANRITTTINGDTFAAAGGEELHTMTTGEMVAHTHTQQGSIASGNASADHTHTWSDTSTGISQNHTHGYSGNTGGQSATHSHGINVANLGSDNIQDTGSGTTVSQSPSGGSTGNASGDHSHGYSGNTGNVSADHTHFVEGTTSGHSATHTHTTTLSGATTSTGSTTPFNNLQPTVIMSKCIYTGV